MFGEAINAASGAVVVSWRERQGEPLFRARHRLLARALKRAGKLLRGGVVALYEGGYLGLEFDGLLFYCDSWSARAWG